MGVWMKQANKFNAGRGEHLAVREGEESTRSQRVIANGVPVAKQANKSSLYI